MKSNQWHYIASTYFWNYWIILKEQHTNKMCFQVGWIFHIKSVCILDRECSTAYASGTDVRNYSVGTTIYRNVRQKFILFKKMSSLSVMSHDLFFLFSCLSDAASGLSDGNEGSSTSGGRHEGRSLKRHQRRSVRSRSRHEKTARAKLNVLNVCTLSLW